DRFSTLARHFDLAVLPQQEAKGDLRAQMIEAALFGSGRPVLVAPYIWKPPARFDRILVAWDRGAPAARALGDALPLLKRANHVELVIVGESAVDLPGFNITRHLARHDVKVELRRSPNDEDEVGNVLLSRAADSGADLLVMGGYGHSRFRETLFGGATRSILDTMTVPTFMAR
ncbi:MAG: universal stress protein, partial [Rhizobiales bacterium]|nr:universal stress protein [Hyphomicrobiales bacterium]